MSAMGAMDTLINDPVRYLVPTVKRVGCGIAAMKVLGCGRMTDRPELALRYSLNLGVDTAVVGVKNIAELDQLVGATQNLAPLTTVEQDELFALARRELQGRDNQAFWLGDAEVLAYRSEWVGAKAS